GLVLFALSQNEGQIFQQHAFSPGPLSHAHGKLSCDACHSPNLNSLDGLVMNVLDGVHDNLGSQGCVNCHDLGEHSKSPHGLDPATWAEMYPDIGLSALQAETECAQCHKEHQSSGTFLEMNDRRCQNCHQDKFDSFTEGHPDFPVTYGLKPRRFSFDHSSHSLKHFAEVPDQAPETCAGCHSLEVSTGAMNVLPFEESCGGCHSSEISGKGAQGKNQGIEIFKLPEVDFQTLSDNGLQTYSWAKYPDGRTNAWTKRWFLNGQVGDRFDKLSDLKLSRLENAPIERLKDVEEFVHLVQTEWAAALEEDLQLWVSRWLSPAVEDLSRDELADLSGQFPHALLHFVQQQWFLPVEKIDLQNLTVTEKVEQQGGSQDDMLAGEDDMLAGEDDMLAGEDDMLAGEDDMLAGEDDMLAGEDDMLAGEDDMLAANNVNSFGSRNSEKQADEYRRFVAGVDWANIGGWYLDGPSLWYRPVQHADSFLKAWIELESQEENRDKFSEDILNELTGKYSAGRCQKCHVGLGIVGQEVNWVHERKKESFEFAHFNHAAHVFNDEGRRCNTCHIPAESKSTDGHDWLSVSKESCVECHGQQIRQDCTLCHKYHASPFIRELNTATMEVFKNK
ncbi:MAG: hypothetical protein GWP38_09580, partial [Planctomycetia bacterium]|nr:hypothetical protein [Planctomycetia bacterium]